MSLLEKTETGLTDPSDKIKAESGEKWALVFVHQVGHVVAAACAQVPPK